MRPDRGDRPPPIGSPRRTAGIFRRRIEMTAHLSAPFTDAWRTIVPAAEDPHRPLPPLLLALTVVTGLVDAVSYLTLGHVFVANMTGNVVFLGFALAGASGFSIAASLVALAAFALGAMAGGHLNSRLGAHRGRLLAAATGVEACLVAVSVAIAATAGDPWSGFGRYLLIVLLGLATGIQNAAARKLAVPDLTTTVLTLTITGIFADGRLGGGTGSKAGRRLVAGRRGTLAAYRCAAARRTVHGERAAQGLDTVLQPDQP